jgi:catechol 2,3-dioxygenase-like lactoylglutathione lyase family enzyme
MIIKLNHASFTVADLKKSVNFYKKILDFKLVNFSKRNKKFSGLVTGIKNAELKIAYLKKANFYLELIEYTNGKGKKIDTSVNNIGSSHICFDIKNFDFFLNKLIKNKVKFVGIPTRIPAGPNKGKRVLYFEDIDNNTLEIISLNKF